MTAWHLVGGYMVLSATAWLWAVIRIDRRLRRLEERDEDK